MSLKNLLSDLNSDNKIITPQLSLWLAKHGDPVFRKDVADALYKQITTPPRVRKSSFSASSAGKCPRAQVLAYLGMPQRGEPDSRMGLLYLHGHFIHLMLQAVCLESGILDSMEYRLSWPKKYHMGTMDGVGTVPDDHPRKDWRGQEFIAEFKGINSFGYDYAIKNDLPSEDYKKQVAKYMLISGIDLVVLLYMNKNTSFWHEWVYTAHDLKTHIDAARKEADVLAKAVDTKTLPPILPGATKGINAKCHKCSFAGENGACFTIKGWPDGT